MDFNNTYAMIGLLLALLIGVILWLIGGINNNDTIKIIGECLAIISAIILSFTYKNKNNYSSV